MSGRTGTLSLMMRAKLAPDMLHRGVYQMGAMHGILYEEMDWEGLIAQAESQPRGEREGYIRRRIIERGHDPKCQRRKVLYVRSLLGAAGLSSGGAGRVMDWPIETLVRDEPIDMIEPSGVTTRDAHRLVRQLTQVAVRLMERGCAYCGGEAHPARASCPNCAAPIGGE